MADSRPNPAWDAKIMAALEEHKSQRKAAQAIGCSRNAIQRAIVRLNRAGATPEVERPIAEELPPSDLPFAERLASMKKRNALRIAHERAKNWMPVKIPVEGPYAITWFGDPHLDDPYCDLTSFERDARITARTPAMFGANGGDSINNWVGKLERLYGEQSATVSEGWELVEWALKDLGVNWLIWILGNHDVWNYGKRIFEGMNTNRVLMADWNAKLRLVSPCGGETRAWARHNFKGTSIYNELHGLKRAAMMDEDADVYAAFHIHTTATGNFELPGGRRVCLIRARGYKDVDHYAMLHQFHEQETGQSVVTIFEPRKGQRAKVWAYDDVEEGAEFLTWKRSKL